MNSSTKLINHMVALLELDLEALEKQSENGLIAATEMLPLIIEELKNYKNKLKLLNEVAS